MVRSLAVAGGGLRGNVGEKRRIALNDDAALSHKGAVAGQTLFAVSSSM